MPNQPKYPGRHLRMDRPRWEALGVLGALDSGDRTKEVLQWLDWALYAPDATAPRRVPPAQLVAALQEAAKQAEAEAAAATTPTKRETLERKRDALQVMALTVAERTAGHDRG